MTHNCRAKNEMEIGEAVRVRVDVRSGELELFQQERVGSSRVAVRYLDSRVHLERPVFETRAIQRFPNAAAAILALESVVARNSQQAGALGAQVARAWLAESIHSVRNAVDPDSNIEIHPYILLKEYGLRAAEVVALYEKIGCRRRA